MTSADPSNLVFEIAETTLMRDIHKGEAFARGIVELRRRWICSGSSMLISRKAFIWDAHPRFRPNDGSLARRRGTEL
ncbi:MAG: hypothetical protein ACLP6E_18105 [Acidimicrobiales bacterium]